MKNLAALATVLLASPAAADVQLEGDSVRVPMDHSSRHVRLDVKVNGSGPYRFLLDTGASGHGRVDRALAEELGLAKVGEAKASDGTGREAGTMDLVAVESLAIGGATFTDLTMGSSDYSRMQAPGQEPYRGILGFDLFEELLLTIDYPGSAIEMRHGALLREAAHVASFDPEARIPTVEVDFGEYSVDAHLDTGSMGSILLPGSQQERVELEGEPRLLGSARTRGGEFEIKGAKLKGDVSIAGHMLEAPQVSFSDVFHHANLGYDVLRDFALSFDQKNGLLRLSTATSQPMDPGFRWPVIEMSINGKGPYRFVLDTGAATTVLHADLVEELGLASLGTTNAGDPSNPMANEVDVLLLDTVSIGGASFDAVEAVGWRGDPLVPFGEIRGVLGIPTFRHSLLTLDYASKRVEVRSGSLPEVDGEEVLPLTITPEGILTLPIEVAGRSFEAHLDSGNSRVLSLPAKHMETMPLVEGTRRTGQGRRASGPVTFTSFQLDGDITIGSLVFEQPVVSFDDKMAAANVGYDLLKNLALTIDQANGRVRLRSPDAPEGATTHVMEASAPRRMGIRMGATGGGGGMRVVGVDAGSAAESAGVQAGDVLVEVNGEAVSHALIMDALTGTDPIELTVVRGEERLTIVVFGE